MPYDIREEISVGGMFLFAGLALIIYYSFARKVISGATDIEHA